MSSTHFAKKPIIVIDDEKLKIESVGSTPECLPYEYQPLPLRDYFRVLEILPGQRQSSFQCNIEHYNLDARNRPPYKALSYTWGESKYDHVVIAGERISIDSDLRQYAIRRPLYCNGRCLLISTNLCDALRSLRHPTLPIQLWVDAVCISQQDDTERSSQILLMARIYYRASRVLLWLGEADDDTQPAFNTIRLLESQLERLIGEGANPANRPGPESLRDEAFTICTGLPPFSSGPYTYRPFLRLLNRPVFLRIWCVQEAAVGGSVIVICGARSVGSVYDDITYADIARACAFLRKAGWSDELQREYVGGRDVLFFPTAVLGTRADWYQRRINRSLVVYEMRSFQATDPRDKIFALFGLLNDYSHRRLHDLEVLSDK